MWCSADAVVYLSVYLGVVYLLICLSVYLSVYLSILSYLIVSYLIVSDLILSYLMYLSIYLSVCLSIYLSICLSVCLSVCLFASLKTQLFRDTSSIRNSERLPQFRNLTPSKTKQFCETSSIFELDNIKNEAILRDVLQKWKIECRADCLVPMRFAIFPLHLS